MNKKGGNLWTWFFIIVLILIITSAVRYSMIRNSMYNDITGRMVNDDYPEGLSRQYEQENQTMEQVVENKTSEQSTIQQQITQQQINEEIEQYTIPSTPSCQSGYINEYRCLANNIEKKYQYSDCSFTWIHSYHCSYGCVDGKCKDCYDSDGGKDYYTKGYIDYGSEGKGYDKCYEDIGYEDYLAEYSCDSSGSHVETYKCPHGCIDGKCNLEPPTISLTVLHVLDGDTIQLSNGETVRLIGINAPEQGQICSTEATDKLRQFVLGKEVTLKQDLNDKDQYGRSLRYIFVEELFVNLEMVRLGLAHKYEFGSNTRYSTQFEQAENEAKQNEGCLWKTSEENYIKDQCIHITNFHFNAAGDDNYNLNDEYVTFENKCSYSIDMNSWTVKDETASHIYTVPPFIFQASSTFTLYTGTGVNKNSAIYWGRIAGNYASIWNNDGDTLFLRDSNGNLVLTQSYSGY